MFKVDVRWQSWAEGAALAGGSALGVHWVAGRFLDVSGRMSEVGFGWQLHLTRWPFPP